MKPIEIQRCDPNFTSNLKKLYPYDSHKKATQKLNKFLEEMLFGIKR